MPSIPQVDPDERVKPLAFKWDRVHPLHNWRVLDDNGGIHMAGLHEAALIDEVERLRTALSEEPRWIPVAERLPPDGKQVALWDGISRGMGFYRHEDQWLGAWGKQMCYPLGDITHWMPLPEAPK